MEKNLIEKIQKDSEEERYKGRECGREKIYIRRSSRRRYNRTDLERQIVGFCHDFDFSPLIVSSTRGFGSALERMTHASGLAKTLAKGQS